MISDAEARENLARNVNYILGARGWSQRDLAEAAERPPMSINHVCRNRRLPSVTLALAIGEVLGYSIEDLTGPLSPIIVSEKHHAEKRDRKKSLIPA